jgi:hypothetical protein
MQELILTGRALSDRDRLAGTHISATVTVVSLRLTSVFVCCASCCAFRRSILQERKQNKHSLRQLLMDEVGLMEAADQQMQDELRAEQQMGRGAMPPPQSPR